MTKSEVNFIQDLLSGGKTDTELRKMITSSSILLKKYTDLIKKGEKARHALSPQATLSQVRGANIWRNNPMSAQFLAAKHFGPGKRFDASFLGGASVNKGFKPPPSPTNLGVGGMMAQMFAPKGGGAGMMPAKGIVAQKSTIPDPSDMGSIMDIFKIFSNRMQMAFGSDKAKQFKFMGKAFKQLGKIPFKILKGTFSAIGSQILELGSSFMTGFLGPFSVFGDLAEGIGGMMSIIFVPLTSMITEMVMNSEIFKSLMSLLQGFPMQAGSLKDALNNIISFLLDAITTLVPMILDMLSEAIPLILSVLTENFPLIVETIIGIIPIILEALVENLPLIVEAFLSMFTVILDNIPTLLNMLVTEAIPLLWTGIVDSLKTMFMMVPGIFEELLDLIREPITSFFGWLRGNKDEVESELETSGGGGSAGGGNQFIKVQ